MNIEWIETEAECKPRPQDTIASHMWHRDCGWLSVRAANELQNLGIETFGQLATWTAAELLIVGPKDRNRNSLLGRKHVRELAKMMIHHGMVMLEGIDGVGDFSRARWVKVPHGKWHVDFGLVIHGGFRTTLCGMVDVGDREPMDPTRTPDWIAVAEPMARLRKPDGVHGPFRYDLDICAGCTRALVGGLVPDRYTDEQQGVSSD